MNFPSILIFLLFLVAFAAAIRYAIWHRGTCCGCCPKSGKAGHCHCDCHPSEKS